MTELLGMQQVGVRIDEQRSAYVPARKVPIGHLLVTATTSGAANTLATVRDKVMLRVHGLRAANITGGAVTLSLHSIPAGGTIGNGNAEMIGRSIAANSVTDLTDLVAGLYEAGTVLKAYASAANSIVLHGWGEEVL